MSYLYHSFATHFDINKMVYILIETNLSKNYLKINYLRLCRHIISYPSHMSQIQEGCPPDNCWTPCHSPIIDSQISRDQAHLVVLVRIVRVILIKLLPYLLMSFNVCFLYEEVTVLPPIHNKNYQESRYKTELCRHWQESGACPHGLQCLFAHGISELKPFRGRHKKYKTQLCKAFHADGFCSFGPRCSYIHSGIDIIPGAIRPFPFDPSQYPRKLSTDSLDSTLDFPSEHLEEELKLLSLGSPGRPTATHTVSTAPKSPSGVRLSVFAKICDN